MKKILTAIILIGTAICVHAQKSTDVNSIFKMLLFLNKPNVHYEKEGPLNAIKDDSLYQSFKDIFEVTPEKLPESWELESFMEDEFSFYKIDLSTSSSKYIKKLSHKEGQLLGLFHGIYTTYVIAIDDTRGKCYRITGFDQSDFFAFLMDFKELYDNKTSKSLSTNKFLKNFTVEGVDFSCLYDGLRENKRDTKKYPCLKRVNDPVGAQ